LTNSGTTNITLTLRNGSGTFSGAINDNGTNKISLVKDGGDTLILSGVNTYSGSTTIANGTLRIASTGSINNTTDIIVNSTGTLDVSPQPSTFTLGSGKKIAVNGTAIGSLAIDNGALLTGTGSLIGSAAGQSVTVNGTVSPGTYGAGPATEGIGTLAVGNLSNDVGLRLGATSVYNWGLSPDGQGLINVKGAVTIDSGAKLRLNNGGQNPSGSYTILTWTGADPVNTPTIEYAPPPGGTAVHWIGLGSPPNREWDLGANWDLGAYQGGTVAIDTTSNWLVLSGFTVSSIPPVSTSAVIIAPASGVAVNGPSTDTTVQSLELGKTDGSSASSLTLASSVEFTATDSTTVHANAGLTVNGTLKTASLASNGAVSVSSTGKLGTGASPVGTVAVNGGETTFASGAEVNVSTLNVNGGTLKVADGGQLGASGVTLGSGTLQLTGSAFNSSKAVTVNGGDINVPVTATISGPIGGSAPLTKTGDGKLIVTGTNTFSSAAVNAGTLQGNVASIKTDVALNAASANVTFDQPSDGAYKKVVSGDGSLTKDGSGILTLSKPQTYGGSTIISGGTLKLQGTPTAPPVADYARWFDASSLDGYADGQNVTQWNDGSVNAAHATTPGGNANPTYLADAGTGTGLPALQFAKNDGADNSGALSFTRDSAIRTVFSIFKGSSFLLTDTDNYDFHRETDDSPTDPLWCGYTSDAIKGGSTYVNGSPVNGESYNMPTDSHNGYNLVEVLTTDTVQADSFNKDRVYHAGDQSQAEVIFYNRVLTNDERLAVEAYLTAKWFEGMSGGNNILPTTTALSLTASGATLDLNGVNQTVASIVGVAGSEVKVGAATLTVGGNSLSSDFSGKITDIASGALVISDGTHELGTIEGTGSTTVMDNASLTADSIVQDTLTIGAGATVTIRPTTGTSANAVPEPGTWVLIGTALLGWLAFRRRHD
jgi:autotransporter-associated beta strand protein